MMNTELKNPKSEIRNPKSAHGFSLTEVLLAVGTLAVGMLFIAGVFPVSVHFTTIAAERTIAAMVADEAFAKIKLYGITPADLAAMSYSNQVPFLVPNADYGYPSTPTADPYSKRYWWSAICRRVGSADIQVTVFVSRKVGSATTYLTTLDPFIYPPIRPVAMPLEVTNTGSNDEIRVTEVTGNRRYVNDGCTLVDGVTGQIYRVIERYKSPNDDVIRLDKNWQGGILPGLVWVIPPPVGSGRYPCIAVYQKVMRF